MFWENESQIFKVYGVELEIFLWSPQYRVELPYNTAWNHVETTRLINNSRMQQGNTWVIRTKGSRTAYSKDQVNGRKYAEQEGGDSGNGEKRRREDKVHDS